MSWSVEAVFNGLVVFTLCLSQCSAGCAGLDSVPRNCSTIGSCTAETGWPSKIVQCFDRSKDSHICNFETYQNAVPTELGVKVDQNASPPIFKLPDAHITASSNNSNAKYARIGLPSDKMWCAENSDSNRWLEIDLGILGTVARIELEPAGQTNSTNFTVSFRNTTINKMVLYQSEKKFTSNRKTTCHYLFIMETDIIHINSLSNNPCFRVAVYGKPPARMAVPKELGIKVHPNASPPIFKLPDAHFTASSNTVDAKYARVGLASDKMWCAKGNNQWLEIDLGIVMNVTRIEVEGNITQTNWKATFWLKFRKSSNFAFITFRNGREFTSMKGSSVHYVPIGQADAIQIHSKSNKTCLRVAVYGYPPVRMAEPTELGVKVPPKGDVSSYYRIPDEDFTASSNTNDAKYARIGLPNNKMWCAANNDNGKWLQIILDVAITVERIDVEGDINQANWEQKFSLSYKTNKDQATFLLYRDGFIFTSRKGSSSHYVSIQKPYAIRIFSQSSKNCFRVAIYGNPIDRTDIHFEDVVQVVTVPTTAQPTAKLLGQDSLSTSDFFKGYLLWAIFLAVFLFLLIVFLTFLFCWCCRREREFERKSDKITTVTETNYVPSWRTIDAKAEKGYLATQEVQEVKIAFTDEYIPPDLKKEKLDPNDETHYRHRIFSFRGWESQKTPKIQVDPAPKS